MFNVTTQEIKKIKTQVWVAASFPAVHSEIQIDGCKVARRQDCLEIDVQGSIVEINKQSLAMGLFRLDGLQGLSQSGQRSAWAVVDAMKDSIEAFSL